MNSSIRKSSRIALSLAAFGSVLGATFLVAPAASAASPITVDFEGDAAGGKPNGYVSPSSPLLSFYDTNGANLSVADFGNQSHGKGLAVNGDDNSALEIRLAAPTSRLSLAFGNDHPGIADATDKAVLTLYRGATQVSQVAVTVNANDVMDQTVTQASGPVFDRATFQYVDFSGTPLNLIEVVDDIQVAPLCTVVGTEGNDVLSGTSGDDVICGGGGSDSITAKGGADLVFAGPGNDTINAGGGLDVVNGGRGNDNILGAAGADVLRGHEGRDRFNGGTGSDRCEGGPGRDQATKCEVRIQIP